MKHPYPHLINTCYEPVRADCHFPVIKFYKRLEFGRYREIPLCETIYRSSNKKYYDAEGNYLYSLIPCPKCEEAHFVGVCRADYPRLDIADKIVAFVKENRVSEGDIVPGGYRLRRDEKMNGMKRGSMYLWTLAVEWGERKDLVADIWLLSGGRGLHLEWRSNDW